jgi:hypothetical protein
MAASVTARQVQVGATPTQIVAAASTVAITTNARIAIGGNTVSPQTGLLLDANVDQPFVMTVSVGPLYAVAVAPLPVLVTVLESVPA